MRVAIVAQPFDDVLPPAQNSIGLIVFNTARRLATRAEVTVFLPASDRIRESEESEGVRYVPVSTALEDGIHDLVSRYPNWLRSGKYLDSPLYYGAYAARIAAALRRGRFDAVHVLNFPQFARIFRALGPSGLCVGLEMQCDWLTQWPRGRVLPGLRACDLVWGVSSHVTDLIRAAFPDLGARLGTTCNGFDPARFERARAPATPGNAPRVLFVGRVSPEKGVHVIIEASGLLVREFPDLELRIVGPRTQLDASYLVGLSDDPKVRGLMRFYDGRSTASYQQHLDRRIAELGIERNVVFAGPVRQADLVGEYGAATVLVNPSFSESFGMSLVEAMASGCPVVGTRIGGMKDIVVEGESGLLVESGDAVGLAAAVRLILADPERRRRLVEAGRERAVSSFSWEARAARIWGELDRVASARP